MYGRARHGTTVYIRVHASFSEPPSGCANSVFLPKSGQATRARLVKRARLHIQWAGESLSLFREVVARALAERLIPHEAGGESNHRECRALFKGPRGRVRMLRSPWPPLRAAVNLMVWSGKKKSARAIDDRKSG